MKYFYGILSILGTILPYSQLVPWISENGFNITQLIYEASESRIGAFAWLDVVVAAVVLIGFILYEGIREKMKYLWLPIIGTLTVGVSLGLPLFLLLREIHLEKSERRSI
ncbi:DUF2834 domain-containing protein [Bacillus horti]|uniref:Lysylphosphatidylglycerol synthetase-like protein (DUF2156 family) n=1 Tax=Caldalkalibacillus horti TaxID=77523 RepID=A0ABT9VXQ4_9BACI|nr:lysylphosphatidylglycerol synthetase-like protein (DUF2156 family) [Bacillus horti]